MSHCRLARLPLVVLACLAMAGCARYSLVSNTTTSIEGTLRVEPSVEWNRVANSQPGDIGASEVWTIDGEGLQSLIFMLRVKDGEPLLNPSGERREKLPKFRVSMAPDEIASLFEATVTRVARSSVFEFRSVAPSTVLGQPGVRMEFSYVDANSIDRDGLAVAAIIDGTLNVISYQGTRLFHFKKYLPEVERIISSAKFISKV